MRHTIKIASKTIADKQPCFIIAEAGINHDGVLERAFKLVDAAVYAKADAVKFQTFSTDQLILPGTKKAGYHVRSTGKKGTFDEMIRGLELSAEEFAKLAAYCRTKKIIFISTPFDEGSADILEGLKVPAYKIDSGNFNNHSLVRHVAKKGKPMILSTGMTTMGEIEETLEVIQKTGNDQVVLLQCTSNYPPALTDVNLRAMNTMRAAFDTLVGYSDHTEGITATIAAVALGATVIEKHLTLDRKAPGPDHVASAEPDQFAELVKAVRAVEAAMGSSIKKPVPSEREIIYALRRSIVSTKAIPKGAKISPDMVAIKRPGTGIPPKYIDWIIGRPARTNIAPNKVITFDNV